MRQLKAAMSDPELAKKIGVDRQRESLGYRIIVKSMERIGDHVENIARNSTMIPKVKKEDMRSIENIGNSVRGLFIKTLDALSMMDIEKANEVIKDANSLTEESEAISEQLLREEQSVDKIHALSVLQSLGRIAKYCEDIAEVTINMGIRGAEE